MKRAGNLYSRIAEPENLRLAYWKAARGKSGKAEVREFAASLDRNLAALRSELLGEDVRVGECHTFTVFDPKERVICAAAFRERVLHHAIMNVCDPVFESYQVFDSYASRRGKGTTAAVQRALHFAGRFPWFVKLDVRKYFDSIDHGVVKNLLRRRFKDAPLLALFDRIIDSYQVREGKGLPIGNLTSQYLANHALAVADHFVKETLRVPAHVRYMDDMVLWGRNRDEVGEAATALAHFVATELRLDLKPPCLNRSAHGLPFLGRIVMPQGLRLSRRSRTRYRGKLRQAVAKLTDGEWSQREFADHVTPLIAHTEDAAGPAFRRGVLDEILGCRSGPRTA